jgi:hypothetical protein
MAQAVSAGLLTRNRGFAPGLLHVGLVVHEVALGWVSLLLIRFFILNTIPS